MPYTSYLKRFVTFSIEKLNQHPSFETFKENLAVEARAIITTASAQNASIELRKLEHYLQTEIKYQLLQYRKRYVTLQLK
ncbi:MAG: hypothetical protein EOO00_09670 [Chitinophagaceae bacterium]|nr:MAG: hypothetical protein EOO00_09670 [Chitinophagaceae bacterium]